MQGKNTIVTTGDYSIGLLSQTSGNLNTDTIIRVNSDGSVTPSFSDGDDTFIVTAGNHAVAFLRVHLPEARVRVYLLLMKKVLPIQEVMKIMP